jgi:hypothetical protein
LDEENVPLPDFDMKTNNVINEIVLTISEIVDILKIIDPYKASIYVFVYNPFHYFSDTANQ